jgi:endonuclease/exonuclease/phosphatase family metal-dependent hydrolase
MSAVLRRAVLLCIAAVSVVATLGAPATAATKPAAPTHLIARTGASTATLSWDAAKNATYYRTCLVSTRDQRRCDVASPRLTTTTHRATGLVARDGVDYYFRVYAYRGSSRTASVTKGFQLKPPVPPDVVNGIKQTVTASTLHVTWKAAAHAREYEICLTGGQTSTRCLQTARSRETTARFTGLAPTAGGDYFYRVRAINGTVSSTSAQQRADLPVGAIATAAAVNGGSGVLDATWEPATNAETYELQVATAASMTNGLRTFTVAGPTAGPTLPIGTTYYYRVRGTNGVQKGRWTPVGSVRLPSLNTSIQVLTYNLCGQDKCVTRSNTMKKWSTRKDLAGKIALASGAGIIATQESHDKDTRFGRELPGYALAAYYSAKSLFYDKAKYESLRSGTITLSSKEKKYAVWAELRDRTTRTSFIVVDAHLQPYKGRTKDDMRATQTKILLSKVASANREKLPVVYAGDFNSNKSNADRDRYSGGYDAPRRVFAAAGVTDTYDTAARRAHADYNSANQAINPPLRHSDHVDHVYVGPGVTASDWRILVAMDGKRYATPFASDHNPLRATLTIRGR